MIVHKKLANNIFVVLLAGLGIFFAFFAYAFFKTARASQAWFYLGGVRVFANTSNLELGETNAGGTQNLTVGLRNLGVIEIKVVGAQVSCNCTQITNAPIQIAAGDSSDVQLSFRAPDRTGRFNVLVTLYVQETNGISTLPISISGFSRKF